MTQNFSVTKEASSSALILTLAPAIIAGLLFAFSRTLWAYATLAEVYTLNALMILTVIWLMFGWRREQLTRLHSVSDRKLYMAALVFGLALGVHHVSVAFILPALALLVYTTAGRGFFLSKRLLYAALISLAGLSIYIYLPIAASRSPLINWGDPSTLERFWWHISGKQYMVFFDFSITRIWEFVSLASLEYGVVWLPFALLAAAFGFASLFRRDRPVFWFLLLIILASLAYCMSYEIADDKDAYYMPAFIAITIAAAFGVHRLIMAVTEAKVPRFVTPGRVAVVLLVLPIIAIASNYAISNRSQYFIANDYVENVFRSVEPNGLVLTGDWQLFSPSLYVRDIAGVRRDVSIIDIRLLRRSWYFNYLDEAYPQITNASRGEIDTFLEDLRGFDQDAEAYDNNITLNQRINDRYNEMVYSLIAKQLAAGVNVYITLELANPGGPQEQGLSRVLGQGYELIPDGLVFRITERGSTAEVKQPKLETRGLNDGTVKMRDDDPAKRYVMPIYLNMLTNSGSYLASKGQHDRAIANFELALKLNPNFEPARRSLSASRNALP